VLPVPFRQFPAVPLLASGGLGDSRAGREHERDAEELPDIDAGAKLELQGPELDGLEQLQRRLDRCASLLAGLRLALRGRGTSGRAGRRVALAEVARKHRRAAKTAGGHYK
jgi:hypothetical protein